jgi:polyhydroxybutyrate depolymerase
VKESLPDTDPTDGRTIERYTYKTEGKPEVVLLKVIGGKHDYPKDIDVHEEAWNFFKRQ